LYLSKICYNLSLFQNSVSFGTTSNDNFFEIESLDSLVDEYRKNELQSKKLLAEKYRDDNDGKRLYNQLIKNMQQHQILEEIFISGLYEIIIKNVNFDNFYAKVRKKLA
jgi:hypothetical protein